MYVLGKDEIDLLGVPFRKDGHGQDETDRRSRCDWFVGLPAVESFHLLASVEVEAVNFPTANAAVETG
jgi:hypothetical protein